MELTFLGATGTVTGSKYLLEDGRQRILVDCGLFQGFKQLRLRNRAPLPVKPAMLDAVILTHAHLDHSGYLPLLVKNGFKGKVYCSSGTRDLCSILLPDSGFIQEEEARYAGAHGFSKHDPPLPLYTRLDAENSLKQIHPVEFHQEWNIGPDFRIRLLPAGHIVGASQVQIRNKTRSIHFTGDLGRPNDPIMNSPECVETTDYLVVESTYGNRVHPREDPGETIARIVNRTFERGGIVLIPAFAVGRAQSLLYYIHLLKSAGKIPDVPVYLNSPMAIEATSIFTGHLSDHRLTSDQCRAMCTAAHLVNSVEESKRLNSKRGPLIIISASGMATGGRVLHHLKVLAPDERNCILFVGFQVGGTRGEAMIHGAHSVKIHGEYVPVRAEVVALDHLSAHADSNEIVDWLKHFKNPPLETFITHGEPGPADALRIRIHEEFGWKCRVADYSERVSLL